MFQPEEETVESQRNQGISALNGLRYPLDASQLPRLLNLRMTKAQECGCTRCDNLLDNLHSKTRILEEAHDAEGSGIAFWIQISKEGGTVKHFECEIEKKLKLTPGEMTRHDEFIDSLVEVEHDWQRSQRATCTAEDTDHFWMQHYQDIKKSIAERTDLGDESLEELREIVMASEG